ncbi:MAG: hypothetical protein ABWY05_01525 [Noviherbaspirillum sp.]
MSAVAAPLEALAPYGERASPLALEPVVLGAGDTVWIVEKGGVDLFHVAMADGEPVGARRHVCRIGPGAALFDGAGLPASALLAVALSGTVWLRLQPGDAAGDAAAAALLQCLRQGWSLSLERALDGLPPEALAPGPGLGALLRFLEQQCRGGGRKGAGRDRRPGAQRSPCHAACAVRGGPSAGRVRRRPRRRRERAPRRLRHRAARLRHRRRRRGRCSGIGRGAALAGTILPPQSIGAAARGAGARLLVAQRPWPAARVSRRWRWCPAPAAIS